MKKKRQKEEFELLVMPPYSHKVNTAQSSTEDKKNPQQKEERKDERQSHIKSRNVNCWEISYM